MSLAERHQRLIEDLSLIPDRQERLTVIVDRSRKLPPFPAAERSAENRVAGCQSAVWLLGELHSDGTLTIRCDADSPMVKGLVHFLCEAYTGAAPVDIASTEPAFLDELGLLRDLSPTRRNGLTAVHARIRELARAMLKTA
ncbi:MAG: SufE family protein [Verrucomicrobia bacterium]|nr:SufE family protein [Verrucomicrobiota bacterium]